MVLSESCPNYGSTLTAEVRRVLRDGGTFILISSVRSDSLFHPPFARAGAWGVSVHEVRCGLKGLMSCHVHVARKLVYDSTETGAGRIDHE